MSFNAKVTFFSLLIIIAIPIAVFFYYKKSHPKYVPPTPKQEMNVTIIPGWNLRDIAADWQKKGIIKNENELYDLLGRPAYNYKAYRRTAPVVNFDGKPADEEYPLLVEKPDGVSYEGYLFPDTYRVYADAKPEDVLKKIFSNLEDKITPEMRNEMKQQNKSLVEVLTMASIVEEEARTAEDRAMVADILWRRYEKNWALQVDSSVHYAIDKTGDVFTTDKERDTNSLWNTYKYPGLPPGPICNPDLSAIKAALYPTKNSYWYFLTGRDGEMHYARTLDEHNSNVYKFLR